MSELAAYLVRALALVGAFAAPVVAAVIGLLAGFGLRALLRLFFVDRGRSWPVAAGRLVAGLSYGGLAFLLSRLTAEAMPWDQRALVAATAALVVITTPTLWLWVRRRRPERRPPVRALIGLLANAVVVLAALLCAALVMMRAGFLELTTDRPVLLVEVTGETRPQTVRWAAPDQPLREEALRSHRVILRAPSGEPLTEAWLYGDQVALKGRVLRLSPFLQIAGMNNLFELSFAHNGYLTAERHASLPHQAVPLKAGGSLSVHPRWRPLRDRLLSGWERKAPADSRLLVRAATTESTYFALVDGEGKPLRHTYKLVLTPGGLTGG